MLNQKSIRTVDESLFKKHVLTSALAECRMPRLDDYCFSHIPDTVLQIFGSTKNGHPLPKDVLGPFTERYDNVVLVLLDAFGWNSFERYGEDFTLLKDVAKNGVVSKITSQFPSTTAAHITTIHSAQPVTEHGVLEWNYFNSVLGRVILPLRNMLVEPEQVVNSATNSTGVSPTDLYPSGNVYKELRKMGIDSYTVVPDEFMDIGYNKVIFEGSKHIEGGEIPAQLANMVHIINEAGRGKNYFYVYSTAYDSLSHEKGFGSDEAAAIAKDFFEQIKFAVENINKKTLLLITADHGMKNFSKCFYLDDEIPQIRQYFRTDVLGRPITMTGGAPDWFLYVREPEQVKQLINKRFSGEILALTKDELIDIGVFGDEERFSRIFRCNLPDVVALSVSDKCLRWSGVREGFKKKIFAASHGALTQEEMDSILLAMEVGTPRL